MGAVYHCLKATGHCHCSCASNSSHMLPKAENTSQGDTQSLVIDEEINAAFQAERLHLEKVVQMMHKQARVVSFPKDLMKEKDDLVWSHAQTKQEIEKEVADSVDHKGRTWRQSSELQAACASL